LEDLIKNLEQLDDPTAQRVLVEREIASVNLETVQALKTLANSLRRANPPKALQIIDLLFFIADLTEQPLYRALAMMVQANVLVVQNSLKEAVALYDQAKALAEQAASPVEAARSQVGKISALKMLSRYQEAIQIAEVIKNILIEHGEVLSASIAIKNEADAYSELGNIQKAVELYDEATHLLARLDTPAAHIEQASILFNSALILDKQGRYSEALERVQQAIQINKTQNNVIQTAIFQQLVARCFYMQGSFNKALHLLLEIIPVFIQQNLKMFEISSKRVLANCYRLLGYTTKAVDLNKELLTYYDSMDLSNTREAAVASIYLGSALYATKQYEEAQIALEQALHVAEQLANLELIAVCNRWLIEVALVHGELNQARALAENTLTHLQPNDSSWSSLSVEILFLLTRIALQQQQNGEAESLAKQALAILEASQELALIYKGWLLLAEISQAKEEQAATPSFTESLYYYQQCLSMIEQMRSQIATESRTVFLQDKSIVYENLVLLYLKQNQPSSIEAAFTIVEQAKSRSLTELIAGDLDIRVRVRAAEDQPLVEEYQRLRALHNSYSVQLNGWQNATSLSNAESDSAVVATNRAEIQALRLECERQMAAIVERLQVRNADYAEDPLLNPTIATFDCTSLPESSVLVEYYIAQDQVSKRG
jgi:tetratricopeptide (TPR) repeat protein